MTNRNHYIALRHNSSFQLGIDWAKEEDQANALDLYLAIVRDNMQLNDQEWLDDNWNYEYVAGLAYQADHPNLDEFLKAAMRNIHLKSLQPPDDE